MEGDSYRISISTPIGDFGDGVMAINRLLGEPVLAMGVASAARLAEVRVSRSASPQTAPARHSM